MAFIVPPLFEGNFSNHLKPTHTRPDNLILLFSWLLTAEISNLFVKHGSVINVFLQLSIDHLYIIS